MQDTPTLLLVDGSSYLYRAFHAMPDLRADRNDPNSQATGAIRGMVNMLQSLRREWPTAHAVCVFDAKGPTFAMRFTRTTRPRARPCRTICAARSSRFTAWCG